MHNPVLAHGGLLAETPDAWPEAAIESAHRQDIELLGRPFPAGLRRERGPLRGDREMGGPACGDHAPSTVF